MDKLYHELLMHHYRYPQNKGTLDNPDFSSEQYIPSCGDQVSLQGTVVDERITRLAFEGQGCVISLASASLLTEYSTGKTVDDVIGYQSDLVLALLGIALGPVRIKCALLPLIALQEGVAAYKKRMSI